MVNDVNEVPVFVNLALTVVSEISYVADKGVSKVVTTVKKRALPQEDPACGDKKRLGDRRGHNGRA
jgi:hypothetical protein